MRKQRCISAQYIMVVQASFLNLDYVKYYTLICCGVMKKLLYSWSVDLTTQSREKGKRG